MRIAIAEAARGDFPFGAVIVRDGDVLSTGRNLGRTTNDPTAHGEMVAIRSFVAPRRRAPGHDPHLGRTMPHVHERYSLVWHRPGGLRRLDR
jgi:tRNA(Arg) A34 adenosine deaminase TadA